MFSKQFLGQKQTRCMHRTDKKQRKLHAIHSAWYKASPLPVPNRTYHSRQLVL
jgi:hypothetical protein